MCASSCRASRPRSPTAVSVARDPLAAGDLIAERRFAYAKAAAEEGDWSAAAELFEQALERAPHWAAAWFALGEAREKLGDLDAAARAFRETLVADPADAQGATARLALIGRGDAPGALPQAYVARLFDDYAPRFDKHLTDNLGYRAPALIAEALSAVAPGRRFASALDLGCGTGLMGAELRSRVDRLAGVDLSAAMIAKARERGFYDRLVVGDAVAMLGREPPGSLRSHRRRGRARLYRRPRASVRRRREGADLGWPVRVLGRNLRGRRIQARADDAVCAQPVLCRDDSAGGGLAAAAHSVRVDPARSGRGRSGPHLRVREDGAARSAPSVRAPPHDSRHELAIARSPRAPAQSVAAAATDKPFGNGRRNRTALRPA